jgi:S1-C subfamily serine protease
MRKLILIILLIPFCTIGQNLPDLTSEQSFRDYFEKNGADLIEGIWAYAAESNNSYRLAIIKEGYKFNAYVLERSGKFRPGDLKATFETAASDQVVSINWLMGDKSKQASVGRVVNNSIIEFKLFGDVMLYRIYPKIEENLKTKKVKTGEWAGNGSGLIISKSGYIVTNHHVIEDADNIEVEFIISDKVQKFNAEIVQVDKQNDLAIIKIFDMNFNGLDDLPYNFKSSSSDVGTTVYAYGYPMALSIMGKEIKVTDGIISAKTGFNGNITTYQITAPIQGGNSGGPLFDDKGNFLGINSSGLRKDLADNVGYTIKSSYVLNLLDVIPQTITLPSNTKLQSLPLTEQVKEITKYVVLVKVK